MVCYGDHFTTKVPAYETNWSLYKMQNISRQAIICTNVMVLLNKLTENISV